MNRRAYLASLGTVTTVGIAGCSTVSGMFGEPCSGDNCDVGMTRTEFVPETYEISAGETVVWKNTSEADHTVTAYWSGKFEEGDAEYFATGDYDDFETADEEFWNEANGTISTRETFEHTFEVPGTYSYVCLPHEDGGMIGFIEVTE
ncbi:plastocyanin/azurin family copper-binding protein [Halostagnicola sp. A-GB9-2]|uniref:cupredoxin domain-containing protein n=1 Tax=Halostagnicola sp. A-GB9-2 TaxID=3048066 RepID=UPI0024C02D43|nr:plastocyanin/azurin family copper-binding protein [Halostagnicola sp. A-GB9-2]MDJ1430678.1 plastocyanin/azurin family copper-binding protein [Halostagnicola sp. A-GB9-2]